MVLLKASETWLTLTSSVGIAVLGMQKEKTTFESNITKKAKNEQ